MRGCRYCGSRAHDTREHDSAKETVDDPITVDEVMEQAQVFASAYSLVGSRFDDGSKLRQSQDEKDNLEAMVCELVNDAISATLKDSIAEIIRQRGEA